MFGVAATEAALGGHAAMIGRVPVDPMAQSANRGSVTNATILVISRWIAAAAIAWISALASGARGLGFQDLGLRV